MPPQDFEQNLARRIAFQKQNEIVLYSPSNQSMCTLTQDLYQRVILLATSSHWKPDAPYPSPQHSHLCPEGVPTFPHWPLTIAEKRYRLAMQQRKLAPRDYYTGDGRIMLPPAVRSLVSTLRRALRDLPEQQPGDSHIAVVCDQVAETPIVLFYHPAEGHISDATAEHTPYCIIGNAERDLLRQLLTFLRAARQVAIYDRTLVNLNVRFT
jgi:hypothetical protein